MFADADYHLRDPEMNQDWNIATVLQRATQVNCGPVSFELFNDDAGQSALNTELFVDDR